MGGLCSQKIPNSIRRLAEVQLAHHCNSIMILFYSLGFESVKYQMNSSQYFLYVFNILKAVICVEQKWTTPGRLQGSWDNLHFLYLSSCGKGTALPCSFWNICSILLNLASQLLLWSVVESVERVVMRCCSRARKFLRFV